MSPDGGAGGASTPTHREDLDRRVDAIEAGYEFMLAYAAQGLPGDGGSGAASEIRTYLAKFEQALGGLANLYRAVVDGEHLPSPSAHHAFLDVLARDAAATQAAIQMVLAQQSISSQLIDNLNASIHVRALLTDIFLIDEALKQ